jgi:hypothetical protein
MDRSGNERASEVDGDGCKKWGETGRIPEFRQDEFQRSERRVSGADKFPGGDGTTRKKNRKSETRGIGAEGEKRE